MSMRLFVDSDMKPAGGSIGAGGSDLSWPRPVRPGDVLHVEIEVTDCARRARGPISGS